MERKSGIGWSANRTPSAKRLIQQETACINTEASASIQRRPVLFEHNETNTWSVPVEKSGNEDTYRSPAIRWVLLERNSERATTHQNLKMGMKEYFFWYDIDVGHLHQTNLTKDSSMETGIDMRQGGPTFQLCQTNLCYFGMRSRRRPAQSFTWEKIKCNKGKSTFYDTFSLLTHLTAANFQNIQIHPCCMFATFLLHGDVPVWMMFWPNESSKRSQSSKSAMWRLELTNYHADKSAGTHIANTVNRSLKNTIIHQLSAWSELKPNTMTSDTLTGKLEILSICERCRISKKHVKFDKNEILLGNQE